MAAFGLLEAINAIGGLMSAFGDMQAQQQANLQNRNLEEEIRQRFGSLENFLTSTLQQRQGQQLGDLGQGLVAQETAQQGYADRQQQQLQGLMETLMSAAGERLDQTMESYDTGLASLSASLGVLRGAERGVLSDYSSLRDRTMARLEGMGDQERADIQQRHKEGQAAVKSDLTRRGLVGSTVRATTEQGLQREESADLGRLEERLRQQYNQTDIATTEALAGARERFGVNRAQFGGNIAQAQFGRASMFGNLSGQNLELQSSLGQQAFGLQRGFDAMSMGRLGDFHNQQQQINTGFYNDYMGAIGGNQQNMIQFLNSITHGYSPVDPSLLFQAGAGTMPLQGPPSAWTQFRDTAVQNLIPSLNANIGTQGSFGPFTTGFGIGI